MRYVPLLWAGIWRRPVRATLTLFSIVNAFLLYGLLQGFSSGLDKAAAEAHADILITSSRVNLAEPLPISQLIEAPSRASSNPARRSTAIGRNASGVPSGSVTKPKPFATLNHLTFASTRRPVGASSVRKNPGRRSYIGPLTRRDATTR